MESVRGKVTVAWDVVGAQDDCLAGLHDPKFESEKAGELILETCPETEIALSCDIDELRVFGGHCHVEVRIESRSKDPEMPTGIRCRGRGGE